MSDFRIALPWPGSLEIAVGASPILLFSELEMRDPFSRYRSSWKCPETIQRMFKRS